MNVHLCVFRKEKSDEWGSGRRERRGGGGRRRGRKDGRRRRREDRRGFKERIRGLIVHVIKIEWRFRELVEISERRDRRKERRWRRRRGGRGRGREVSLRVGGRRRERRKRRRERRRRRRGIESKISENTIISNHLKKRSGEDGDERFLCVGRKRWIAERRRDARGARDVGRREGRD